MANPYLRGNVTKMKTILPVGKRKAWRLIATPRGIASWFPISCTGRVAAGSTLRFHWPDGETEWFQVLRLGEKRSSFHMQWRNCGRVRYYLHGKLTTLTLEVEYPKNADSRGNQVSELAHWAFFLANLKSVALNGPDLRNKEPSRSWKKGFID